MIDIKRFCATNDIRQFLNQPFKLDGRVVASNIHVMIIVPEVGINDYENLPRRHEGILKTIERIESVSQWRTLDKDSLTFPELAECGVCKGMGKAIKEDCEECGGEGVTEASNNFTTYYDLECGSCTGLGYSSTASETEACPDCYGAGTVYPKLSHVDFLGRHIQANYLRLIINETDLRINFDAEAGILFFKTDEAVGAIMGMRKPGSVS